MRTSPQITFAKVSACLQQIIMTEIENFLGHDEGAPPVAHFLFVAVVGGLFLLAAIQRFRSSTAAQAT